MPLAPSSAPTAFPTILVADDQEVNLELMSHVLKQVPVTVVLARNGKEAFEMAQQHRPALVLVDIMMPSVDGLQCIKMLRASPTTSATPIVAVTAITKSDAERKITALGADGYLAKPFLPDEVLAVVRRFVPLPSTTA